MLELRPRKMNRESFGMEGPNPKIKKKKKKS